MQRPELLVELLKLSYVLQLTEELLEEFLVELLENVIVKLPE